MLQLKNIVKDYPAGENTVHALKGISLSFRKSEFVSILGPSGCGKTTMLNIIGGLDQYTAGDLVIDGTSTKAYKDRDWDAYRNHSIGFVFQSYNLIPHQSVLQNVELALTLSGVSKKERRARATEALRAVGLGDQLKKRPGEMSGGQMQRVAIARALVNNPDIILADEPTGALDTETSLQVMEILKEVAKDRLVIMVTHNPDLAQQYSTRIIRMLDGVILSDSDPLSEEELASLKEEEKAAQAAKKEKKAKKPSMKLTTAFGLSLKNLFTKKGRTALTSFAGSIGIIGIALIYAVSQGMTTYINMVQEDTLSSYPLTIEATNVDISTLMQTFMGRVNEGEDHDLDGVYSKAILSSMVNALNNIETTENDLKAFKQYIEDELAKGENSKLDSALNGVQYGYNLDLLIYTKNADGDIIVSDTQQLLSEFVAENFGAAMFGSEENANAMVSAQQNNPMASMMTQGTNMWVQLMPGKDGSTVNEVVKGQYDLVHGSWPDEYNEVVLILDKNHEISDLALYALGLKEKAEITEIFDAVLDGHEIESETERWTYEQLCELSFKTVLNSDCYTYDELTETYTDLRDTDAGLKYLYDNAETIRISGIVRPNEDAAANMINGTIGYTYKLTEFVIEEGKESAALQAQQKDTETDIFTGLPFKENTGSLSDKEKEAEFKKYVDSLSQSGKAAAYVKIMSIPSQDTIDTAVKNTMKGMTRKDMEKTMIDALTQQMGMAEAEVEKYVKKMDDDEIKDLFKQMIEEQVKMQTAAQVQAQLAYVSPQMLASYLDNAVDDYTTKECAKYYDEVLEFSDASYDSNIIKLGGVNLDDPSTINLYASSFENKDIIEEVIADYNEGVDELQQITYVDYVGLMMSSITTIINAITYVLIAFVAISLVVSSIMIGVITLISVQERTKEIGVLRAIGASKRNVSSMFNAETVIIGFTSGALGIGITYLLCIPINAIIQHLTGIANLKAILPLEVAAVLIGLSMLLNLISGVIPSRSAAKKDPVVALRSE